MTTARSLGTTVLKIWQLAALITDAARALYVVPNVTENNWFEGNAGNQTVSGYGNFGTGDLALHSVTNGYDNVAIGSNALNSLTSGYWNFGMGSNALRSTVSDHSNVAIGYNALYYLGESGAGGGGNTDNIVIGFNALSQARQGYGNVILGASAGRRYCIDVYGRQQHHYWQSSGKQYWYWRQWNCT